MEKELLKGIINLLIEHIKKNYKTNRLSYRIAVLCVLYPLKLYSNIVTERGARWFFEITDIKNKFNTICQQAVIFNINKKKGGE